MKIIQFILCCENDGRQHQPPTLHDVEMALKKLNNDKSSGPDDIKAELININDSKLNTVESLLTGHVWTRILVSCNFG